MSDGAVDADFDEVEGSYEAQLADALEEIETEPFPGSIAIDLITRQPLFVRRRVADTLGEYYHEESFDLATYKQHIWLPVRADDAVYECYYLSELSLDSLHEWRDINDYDFPRGRLARVPVEQAWRDVEVGSL